MPLVATAGSPQERRRLVDRAWQTYVVDGVEPQGLSDEISRSWQRAREAYRIDPALTRCARVLGGDALVARREVDDVFRLATPILGDFAARLGLAESVLAYFDRDGWMLSIDGNGRTVEAIAEIGFRPGASWAEDAVGTNGPGTALAEGKPVEVFASEHFVAAWQRWSCAAAPVRAPGEAAPAGLVDITGPWELQRRQALLLARAIARAVEERLRAATSVRDEVVRHAFRGAHHTGDALVAVDGLGRVVAANDSAARRRVVEAGALPLAAREALARALRRRGADSDREILVEPPEGPPLVIAPVCHEGAPIGAIVRAPAAGGERARRARAAAVRASRYDFARIAGDSAPLRRAVELARVAARNQLPVVLCGESGTGKELFAHAIHGAGERAGGPFVAVNCGSIPSQLVESELFGYEAGTFTGGRREGSPGRFEDADGGTLFLDEVSELSGPAQTALLRVLQEREVVRLGGSAARAVDVRVVAATNKPLEEEIRHGRFRRDLYYRLNVLSISVPPLRERGEDLVLLARLFLAEAEAEVRRRGLALADDGLAALRAHPWPGNVRELRNVLLRAAATARTESIGAADLLLDPCAAPPAVRAREPAGGALERATGRAEREALLRALETCRWNFARAAEELGVSRMTLYRRLARHGIARSAAPRR